jgi:phosphoglycolate phosphatase
MVHDAPAVLFDLDGTLVDSASDLCVAANVMRASFGMGPADQAQFKLWIGNGVEHLVHRAMTNSFDGQAPASQWDAAMSRFVEAYAQTDFTKTPLLPGARSLLTALRAEGFPCALVTNKHERPTAALLDGLELTELFDAVICGDSLAERKPSGLPLLVALERCERWRGWMIGDSPVDGSAAKAAKVPFLALRNGYSQGQDLAVGPNPAAVVLDSLDELLDAFGCPIEMLQRPEAFS